MKISFHNLVNQYPFYKKARDLWTETQVNQIIKGLEKYPEPFKPKRWTAKQLLNHALEEAVDLVHYIVGLMELIEDHEETISRQAVIIASLEERIEYLERVKFDYIEIKAPYADLDDE